MMIDVNCPYCESAQRIAIDDKGGADEDTKFEHLCRSCDTSFAYTVQIHLTATATPARCIDSGEHDLELSETHPRHQTVMQCKDCGHYRSLTEAERIEHGIPDNPFKSTQKKGTT